MSEETNKEIEDSVERLMNNFSTIHWIDLCILRHEQYPSTLGDKKRLIWSLVVRR